ncbi:MAG TPA: hypothetical protein VK151_16725 [Fluviicola sp.]|nr:hypothetical protein [Fluviicola sp.]
MKRTLLLLSSLLTIAANAQNVGINATGAAPAASAMLDISSTNSGLLIPRMTTAQRTAIAAPATGLLVYDTNLSSFYYYDGTQWVWMLSNTTGWTLSGNTIAAANLIGTTNAQPFRVFCNNVERFRLNPTDGEFVAGATASPYAGDLMAGVATAALTFAVNGYCSVNGSGVWGETMAASTSNFSSVQGVYSGSGAGSGVLGNYNGTNTGATRSGVYGICGTPTASIGGAGVYGYNSIANAATNQHIGVLGNYNGSSYGIGVHGVALGGGIIAGNNDVAVVGWRANNSNYSGYFNGNHVIANGTKSASVPTSKGNQLLYVTEAPEVWFEDLGGGKLVNGEATIQLDPLFLETVVIDADHPMRVFIQMEGESQEVYVTKGTTSFTVKERNGGTSNAEFSYRIMAKRLHFQDHRFGNDPVWGPGDTHKYSQYAPPPPIDYDENVKFQEAQRASWKQTPMPEGFIYYDQIQKEAKERELMKTPPAEN